MNIEDIIKNMVASAEEVPSAKHKEKDFGEFMEGVLKDIFGEDVKFEKVREVDDGKNDIHIEFKPKGMKNHDEVDDPFTASELVFDNDDKDIILHAARKIAQKHKKEMPVTATYTLLAAFLSKKGDECKVTSLKAFKEAQEASQRKSRANVASKFNDFTQSLSDEERDALNKMLKDM